MEEVTSAVVATSLVLISVFVPVSFFPGTTGILYKQFSLTIAFSIAISLFNALTLSPALAAILLRGEEAQISIFDWTHIGWLSRGYRGFAHGVDRGIHGLGSAYGKAICKVLNYRYVMIVLFLAGLGATGFMYHARADRIRAAGRPELFHRGRAGAARARRFPTPPTVAKQAEKILLADPDVFGTFAVPGFSLSGGSSSNYGLVFAPLKPISEREGKGHSAADIVARVASQALRHSGRDRGGLRTTGHQRHRQLRRIPVRAAGSGPQHAAGPRQRGAQDRGRQPPAPGLARTVHQLYRERSAAAGADRPREGQSHRRADQPGHAGAAASTWARNT